MFAHGFEAFEDSHHGVIPSQSEAIQRAKTRSQVEANPNRAPDIWLNILHNSFKVVNANL